MHVTEVDVSKIVMPHDINKALSCDTISVRMIKICDHALGTPLCLINNDCTKTGISQIYGKKSCSSLYEKKTGLFIIIELFLFFLYVVKSLKEFCSVEHTKF